MPLPNLSVLIVEDNAGDRKVAAAILTSLKVRNIQEAENGSIAESKLYNASQMKQAYDLILLDWNLPKIGSSRLLEQIKTNKQFANTKIVIITAQAEKEIVEAAMMGGAHDFLVKPLTLDVMKAKLEKLFAPSFF